MLGHRYRLKTITWLEDASCEQKDLMYLTTIIPMLHQFQEKFFHLHVEKGAVSTPLAVTQSCVPCAFNVRQQKDSSGFNHGPDLKNHRVHRVINVYPRTEVSRAEFNLKHQKGIFPKFVTERESEHDSHHRQKFKHSHKAQQQNNAQLLIDLF